MTCNNCGSPEVVCVDSEGGTQSGRFIERYVCNNCGATGQITGRNRAPPKTYRESGEVFGHD